jgi:amidohydrolase
MTSAVHRLPEALVEQMIELRREIHAEPELSNNEHRTQARVRRTLESRGLDNISTVAETGLVVDITGRRPGKTFLLRADMDALPIQENRPDLPFASGVKGIMHACGHDAHTAMLVAAAVTLNDMREQLCGTVRCVFQPAEETEPLGGRAVVEAGTLEGVDAALALHIDPDLYSGTVGTRDGALLAGGMEFVLTVDGRSSHAAKPHRGVDSILAAAAIVQGLQAIASRRIDPLEPFVLTVGKIHGGTAKNIIAEQTVLEGTVRMLSERLREQVPELIRTTAESIAGAHGASASLELSPGEPVLENHPDIISLAREAARSVIGDAGVVELGVGSMGSEDFAFYTQVVPGAMFRLGVRGAEDVDPCPLHHPQLNVDESALTVGAEVFIEAARQFLRD